MPTGVSLFVWLPEERAKWVEMRATILHRRRVATDGHYGLLTPQASLVMSLCPQERGHVVAASCCGGRAGCLVSPHFLFRG
jgi:hypothetical protein